MESGATHAIFFIAALVVAGAVVGTFSNSIQRFSGDIDKRGDQLSDELTTDITIINDPGSIPNDPLILFVLNSGTRTLYSGETVVFIDGNVDTGTTYDVLGSADDSTWATGQVLKITLAGQNLATGDHRVKVSVMHGVADTIRFYIS